MIRIVIQPSSRWATQSLAASIPTCASIMLIIQCPKTPQLSKNSRPRFCRNRIDSDPLAGARAAAAGGDRRAAASYYARLLAIGARADQPGRPELIEARRVKARRSDSR